MNKRHHQILSILNQDDWITGKELSNILRVTDRTIRYDIEKINNEFKEIIIESNIRQGYRLTKDIHQLESPISQIPQTPKERCLYILKKLLLAKNQININKLVDEIYISKYSLENDLKKIKEDLKQYHDLSITKTNQILSLTGCEQNKRKLYKDLLLNETNNNLFNLNDVASLYKKFNLLKIKQILENILNKYNYQISSISFPILILHIGVTIERLLNENYLDQISFDVAFENTLEYKIADEFFDCLFKLHQIKKQESEIKLLALLIMSKKNQNIFTLSNSLKYENLVQELINYISSQYYIDFSIDNELAIGLSLHIQSLVERSKINALGSNVYLDEIKKKYPLIFDIAITACNFLQKKLKIQISEGEIGFFALHLGTAYERQNLNKYKAVMIIPQQASYKANVLKRIENTFKHHLDIIEVLSYYEKETIKKLNPDLLISSIPLKHDLNIVSSEISVFFNYQDEVRIFQSISECEKENFIRNIMNILRILLEKKIFFITSNLIVLKMLLPFFVIA